MTTLAWLGPVLGDAYDGHHGWGGGWMWLGGTLMMLVFTALVAGAIWVLARREREPRHTARPSEPARGAREILDERYVRGEIESEEYREKVRDLGESH